jgi:hypothetical protein
MVENGTGVEPSIMVLEEGSKIEVNKGQLRKLESSDKMLPIDDFEINIQTTKTKRIKYSWNHSRRPSAFLSLDDCKSPRGKSHDSTVRKVSKNKIIV